MRMGLGLIGLLVALALVAVLVKKQMAATRVAAPPAVQGLPATEDPAPTVRAQSQQIQQQVREQLDAAMQPRPLPQDAQ